jgi:hypothetical protein
MTSYASQGSDSDAAVISTGIDGVMNVMMGQSQWEGMRPPEWLHSEHCVSLRTLRRLKASLAIA